MEYRPTHIDRDVVSGIREDVDRLDRQATDYGRHIGDLREKQALMAGRLRHLLRAYERAAEAATAQVHADLEVRKAGALATIKDRTAAAKHKREIIRELVFKGVVIMMGAWAIVVAALNARC